MLVRPSARRLPVRTRGAALLQYVVLVGLIGLALTLGMRSFGAKLSSKADAQGLQLREIGRAQPATWAAAPDVRMTAATTAELSKPSSETNVTVLSAASSTPAGESKALGLGSILLLVAGVVGAGGVVISISMRVRARSEQAKVAG